MAEGYKAKVVESSMELSAKERIYFRQMADCEPIEELTRDEAVFIERPEYVVVDVVNENVKDGQNKNYRCYLIVDGTDKTVYKTSSDNFFKEFKEIYDEMHDSEESWSLKCMQKPSKNYTGKSFLTCTVV